MKPSNVLIVERDPLVALDLTQTVGPLVTGSIMNVVNTLAEAEACLGSACRFALVLLDTTREELRDSDLIGKIRKISDAIIVMDSLAAEAIEEFDDYVVVRRPFSSDMVEQAFALCRKRPRTG